MQAPLKSPADALLVVKKDINATPEEVYQAFIDPELLTQWMGPGDVTCLSAETDPQVGGSYRIHMRSDQGDHIVVGEYITLEPEKKLSFTWSWETGTVKDTLVTVLLQPTGAHTTVEIIHERFPDRDATDKHTHGWTSCLENFANLFSERRLL